MKFIKLHDIEEGAVFINFDIVCSFVKDERGSAIFTIKPIPDGWQPYTVVKETPEEICKLLGVSGDGD